MAAPKVSVIIPVFNVKAYLCECLDSILAQTLYDLEIICGDGGSTDGSLEIIQKYAKRDHRIRYITKEGSGYGQSVNECIDMAQGEYIGIVESDDVIESDAYEILYDLAIKNNLDWVRSDIYLYYSGMPKDKQLQRESIIYDGDFYNTILNPQTDYRPYKSGLRTWSGIYKTLFLRENDIRHNETPGGSYQDVGFYLKTLYYAKRVYFLDRAFYKWRQDNPGSSVHYNSAKLVEKSLNEWHLNQQYLDEHPNIGRRAYASYNYRKFFSYLWTIDMANNDDKLIVQKQAAKEFTSALECNKIDKGFFDEQEWERFTNELHNWKKIAGMIPPELNHVSASHSHSFKQFLKRILRPLAVPCKKIVYKLMGSVIFTIENDISSLRLYMNESIEDTRQKIYENTAELQKIFSLVKQINENTVSKALNQDIVTQFEVLKAFQDMLHQKLLEQGDVLWSVKSRCEDIHDKAALVQQKVLDQGEILWGVKSRCEDIHDKAALIQQKVLDQGDLLWNTRSRVEDIYTIDDSFLAHPQYGASQNSHNAVKSVVSLLTTGNDQEKRECCKKFLASIEIETFSFCNRRCWFCPNRLIDRHSDNHYMSEEMYLKILTELQEIDYSNEIAFSRYNEPLSDRIILTRIKQAREYCPKAYLLSNTNGDYLTREYLEELVFAGLNELRIQCYFEEHEEFSFLVYKQRLNKIVKKLKIDSYVIDEVKENDRFKATLAFDGLNLTFFSLNMCEFGNNRGGSLDNMKEYHRTQNCVLPFRKMFIDYTGAYMLCCNMRSDVKEHQPYIIGDVAKESVFDIFCGKKMIEMRKLIGTGQHLPKPCSACQYLTLDDDFPIF